MLWLEEERILLLYVFESFEGLYLAVINFQAHIVKSSFNNSISMRSALCLGLR